MIDGSPEVELEEFEQVEAGPGTVLLRIAAKTSPGRPTAELVLQLDGGAEVHRLTPLPAPPEPSGQLRVAFSAPSGMLLGTKRFTLLFPDGVGLPLPAPRRRSRAKSGEAAVTRPPSRRAGAPGPRHTRAPGTRPPGSIQRETNRTALLEERRLREQAETQTKALRHAVDELERQLESERVIRQSQDERSTRESEQLERLERALAGAQAKTERLLAAQATAAAELERALGQQLTAEAVRILAEQHAHRAEQELTATRYDASEMQGLLSQARRNAGIAQDKADELVAQRDQTEQDLHRLQQELDAGAAALSSRFTVAESMVRDLRHHVRRLLEQQAATAGTRNLPDEHEQTLERKLRATLAEHAAVLSARSQAEQDAAQLLEERSALGEELDELRAAAAALQGGILETEARGEALAEVVRQETDRRKQGELELDQSRQRLEARLQSMLVALAEADAARRDSDATAEQLRIEAADAQRRLAAQLEAVSRAAVLEAQSRAREEIEAALTRS